MPNLDFMMATNESSLKAGLGSGDIVISMSENAHLFVTGGGVIVVKLVVVTVLLVGVVGKVPIFRRSSNLRK